MIILTFTGFCRYQMQKVQGAVLSHAKGELHLGGEIRYFDVIKNLQKIRPWNLSISENFNIFITFVFCPRNEDQLPYTDCVILFQLIIA